MNAIARLAATAILVASAGCGTTDSNDWRGGGLTSFDRAEKSCEEQMGFISQEEDKRAFFIGCMAALGWVPTGEPSIDT